MANILFDFTLIAPSTGGINQVCRLFVSEIMMSGVGHKWFVRWPGERSVKVELISNGKDCAIEIDKLLAQQSKTCLVKNQLNRGSTAWPTWRICTPMKNIWRSFMGYRRRVLKEKEIKYLSDIDKSFERECFAKKIDIIHCPFQWMNPHPPKQIKGIKYIINMHDLQHEHFPEFFSDEELAIRRSLWYESAKLSRFVVVAADHVKKDVVKFIGLKEEKVKVIPWGPLLESESFPNKDKAEIMLLKYKLPKKFLFYPAVMWPHKNHLRILEALSVLKEKGVSVSIVFTGGRGSYSSIVRQMITDMGLDDSVFMLGFISHNDIKAMYRTATGMICPSLHEQSSIPVMEAMTSGCPVAASDIADHGELLGNGAGILVDPKNVDDIVSAIEFLWTSCDETQDMAECAKTQIHKLRDWGKCRAMYHELYDLCIE